MSCEHASFNFNQASRFFLDRLITSSVIQSGSLGFGAGGSDSQAFWIVDLKVLQREDDEVEEAQSNLSNASAKVDW